MDFNSPGKPSITIRGITYLDRRAPNSNTNLMRADPGGSLLFIRRWCPIIDTMGSLNIFDYVHIQHRTAVKYAFAGAYKYDLKIATISAVASLGGYKYWYLHFEKFVDSVLIHLRFINQTEIPKAFILPGNDEI